MSSRLFVENPPFSAKTEMDFHKTEMDFQNLRRIAKLKRGSNFMDKFILQ